MLNINVQNIVFGKPTDDTTFQEVRFSLPLDAISLRDLIARSVENQIECLLESEARTEQEIQKILQECYICEDDIEAQAKVGKIALNTLPSRKKTKTLIVGHEIERAVKSFEQGRFKVLINGSEITELDQLISYNDVISVKFLQIVPLAGG